MYDIVFSKNAEKDFNSLSNEVKNRVVHVLERMSINPYRYTRRLKGRESFRARVGDYRILLNINEKKKIMDILRVGHRKNVYDW